MEIADHIGVVPEGCGHGGASGLGSSETTSEGGRCTWRRWIKIAWLGLITTVNEQCPEEM
jgi:hypothetical protein